MSRRTRKILKGVLIGGLIVVALVLILFPFYWMVVTSLKDYDQIRSITTPFIPNPINFQGYENLLINGKHPFLTWFKNSLTVALVVTPLTVIISALAAYALIRLRFVGAGIIASVILIVYLVPGSLLFIPMYQVVKFFGLVGQIQALWLVYPTFSIPFATWLLMGYVQSLPEDLEEAAMIDGASRLQTLIRIVLPLMAPALLAIFLFTFTGVWNEYLYAFVLLSSESQMTVPVGMTFMIINDIFQWPDLMAASVLLTVPVVILFIYTQRYMVEGLTAGGVKGEV
jgi:multiple sugar transport system permease protein